MLLYSIPVEGGNWGEQWSLSDVALFYSSGGEGIGENNGHFLMLLYSIPVEGRELGDYKSQLECAYRLGHP